MATEDTHSEQGNLFGEGEDYEEEIKISEISSTPCKLVDVVIEGNTKTDAKIIEHYLESARKAQTLGELTEALQIAREELLQLGIFDLVDIVVDAGPVEMSNSATAFVSVEENTGVSLSGGTYLKDLEPVVEASGEIKNKLGKAESVQGHVSWGKESSTDFGLGFHLPHFFTSRRGQLTNRIRQTWHHWKRYSSHRQSLRGFSLAYNERNHHLTYNFTWRKNVAESDASPEVRRSLGHSLLSSLTYSFSLNRLNSHIRPREGYALNITTQVAGLGPGANFVRFIKQQAGATVAFPLPFLNGAISSSVQTGVLLPWSSNGRPPMINDKFFLGGPNPLRGFRTHGVGPTGLRPNNKGHDFLGADILLNATTAISLDFPSAVFTRLGLHGHGFACAGNLVPLSTVSSTMGNPRQLASDFLSTMRYSAGVGIVSCSKWLGRIELNYCWVLKKQDTDKIVKHGFQVCWNGPSP